MQLLSDMEEAMAVQTANSKALQLSRIKKDSKIKSLQDNIKFLEGRVSQVMTEKEEQAIQLKSEIIIYQQKAKQYKEKMKSQKEQYDEHTEHFVNERVEHTKQTFVEQIEALEKTKVALEAELEGALGTI